MLSLVSLASFSISNSSASPTDPTTTLDKAATTLLLGTEIHLTWYSLIIGSLEMIPHTLNEIHAPNFDVQDSACVGPPPLPLPLPPSHLLWSCLTGILWAMQRPSSYLAISDPPRLASSRHPEFCLNDTSLESLFQLWFFSELQSTANDFSTPPHTPNFLKDHILLVFLQMQRRKAS